MKNLIKISLIASSILIANSAFSGVAEYTNVKATCYIFKSNNQLGKKLNCTYSGHTGSTIQEHTSVTFYEQEFKIPNYGKIIIEGGSEIDNQSERVIDNTATINSKYALAYYRNKSLKIISQSQAENNWENILQCYKSESLNFCYINH